MEDKDKLLSFIEGKRDLLVEVSDSIWEFSETRFEEYKSSELLCKVLLDEGFVVDKGIADMETAFIATYGSGKPIIGILGEYDALHGLSQKAGIASYEPLKDGGKGHGCGHHALGASALAAAIAIKEYIKENGIIGTVKYFGCPGEEGGSGKAYLARSGYFKDVDVALTCHPSEENSITGYNFLATITAYFKFHGISSHAGASPHLGRSALDAVSLMNVGVNYLREHVVPDARIHYAVTNSGGLSPNVVQSEASVLYQIRAPKLNQVREIYDRIQNVAKGAALMTDTTLEVIFDRASSNLVPNRTLEKLAYEKLMEIGPVPIDEEDLKFARKIISSLNEEEKKSSEQMLELLYGERSKDLIKLINGKEIVDTVFPYTPVEKPIPASTDIGDISWNVAIVQILTVCYANNTPGHSWQKVAQGKSNLCHKGMLHAGKVMALTAVELFENLEQVEKIKKEFEDRFGKETYICPIPPDVKPSPRR